MKKYFATIIPDLETFTEKKIFVSQKYGRKGSISRLRSVMSRGASWCNTKVHTGAQRFYCHPEFATGPSLDVTRHQMTNVTRFTPGLHVSK